MKELLQRVKDRLRPDPRIKQHAAHVVAILTKACRRAGITATCKVGGSLAKGTNIKDSHDVDIFVIFSRNYKSERLADYLEQILNTTFVATRVHGSRDYFQFDYHGLVFEIVPVLQTPTPAKAVNVTDVSPLHVSWVKPRLTPRLIGEIRLTKQFLKAHNLYGAESYIAGFSGHVVDILIIVYGSFLNLLQDAQNWTDRVIIDVEQHLTNPLKELNPAKLHSPLIIVDPIQPSRNAAAALSKEKFEVFKKAARRFLHYPTQQAFIVKTPTRAELEKLWSTKNYELIILSVQSLTGKKDVVGAKLLKVFTFIKRALVNNDFVIVAAGWTFTMMYYVIKKQTLSLTKEHLGPPITQKANVQAFKKKHKKTRIKNMRITAIIKRRYRTPQAVIKDLLTQPFITERVKKIRLR